MSLIEKKTILLVEDEFILAIANAQDVERLGYEVITANSGEDAVKITLSNKIDLILMDIDLGKGIDGTQAAELILKEHEIPVVFLSSHIEPEIVEKTEKITSYGYVVKNSGNTVLAASIKMAFKLFDANKRIADSEVLLRKAQEIAHIGHFKFYPATGIVEGSDELFHIFGLTREEFQFSDFVNSVHPDDRSFDIATIQAAIEKKTGYEIEHRLLLRNGTLKWVKVIGEFNSTYPKELSALIGTVQDITERKLATEALRESEESLSTTLYSIGDAVIATDTNGCITRMNTTAERLTGWNLKDALNHPLLDVFNIINTFTRKQVVNPVEKVLETGQVIGLANHTILISKDKIEYQISDSAAPILDSKGKVRGVILVFSDVSAKYKTEEKLQESEEKYRSFFDHEPNYCYQISPDGLILDINPSALLVLGYASKEEIIGKPHIATVYAPDCQDNANQLFIEWQETGELANEELLIITKNGKKRTIILNASVVKDANGKLLHSLLVQTDITERKKVEDTLRETNNKFLDLANNIKGNIAYVNANTLQYEFINKEFVRSFGLPQEKIIGRHIKEIIGEANYQFALKYIAEVKSGKSVSYENSFNLASGKRWIQVNYSPIFNSDGVVTSITVMSFDITEFKQIEEALRVSGARFKAIFEQAAVGMAQINSITGEFVLVNQKYADIIGYSKEEMCNTTFQSITHPDDLQADLNYMKQMIAGKIRTFTMEKRYFRKDTSTVWVKLTVSPIWQIGEEPTYHIAIVEDITLHKQVVDTLRERERDYHRLIENLPSGVVVHTDGKIILVNNASLKFFGGERLEQLIGSSVIDRVHPDFRALARDRIQNSVENNFMAPLIHEKLLRLDGSVFDAEVVAIPILYSGKESILAMFHVITERKLEEEALQEIRNRYELAISGSSIGIWDWDIENGKGYVSDQWCEMLGYKPNELLLTPVNWVNLQHPDDREHVAKSIQTHLEKKEPYAVEFRMQTKSGEYRWYLTRGKAIWDEAGVLIRMVGSTADISERKRIENEVLKSKQFSESIINNLPGIFYVLNKDGKFLRVNEEFLAVSMYSLEEVLRMHPLDFFSVDEKNKVGNAIQEVFEKGKSFIEAELLHKGGRQTPYYFTGFSITIDNEPLLVGLGIDISIRKNAEEKVKSLLFEKELILREVHHRIKNNMTTVSSLLSLQAIRSEDKAVIVALQDAKSRVQSMMVLYDKLYLSSSFNDTSAKEYLISLTDQIVNNFPNSIVVQIEKDIDEFILDIKRLSSIGIIVNEMLTNIMKYAFAGRESGVIRVSAHLKANIVTIIVEDNGNGIPESIDFETSSGFGLTLIGMLAKNLRGSLQMERDNGTRIKLEFEK